MDYTQDALIVRLDKGAAVMFLLVDGDGFVVVNTKDTAAFL
jgi:hypothetical protein